MHDEVTAVVIAPPKYEIPRMVMDPISRQCGKIIVVRGRQRALQRNLGLKLAKTKYVLMVDTDEVILPGYVETLLSTMGSNVAVSCGSKIPHVNLPRLAKLEEYFKLVVALHTHMPSGRLYDRDKTIEVGGFMVVQGELSDFPYELLLRMKKNGYALSFEPKAVMVHLNNYTLRRLIIAGLTSATTKNTSLMRLFARTFSAPIRVSNYMLKVYSLSQDKLVFVQLLYAPLRQLLFFFCGLVRRVGYRS